MTKKTSEKEISCIGYLLILLFLHSVSCFANPIAEDDEKETLTQAVQAIKNGAYDNALTLFDKLIKIRSNKYGSTSVPVANVLTNLGVIKSQLGQNDQAIEFYQQAEKIYLTGGDKELKHLSTAQQNLAICFNAKGDYNKAEQYFENAGRILQSLKISESRNYEVLLLNQAALYIDNNTINKAADIINKALKFHTDKSLNFKKWNLLGMIALKQSEYQKSIQLFTLDIKTGENDLGTNFSEKGLVYLNLGMVYLETEEFEKSVSNYKIAKILIENNLENQGVAYSSCLKDLGLNYLKKKENENNVELFIEQRIKNILTALEYFQKSLIAITPGFKQSGIAYNPLPEDAIDKTKLLDALKNKAEALLLLAKFKEKQEKNTECIQFLKSALETFDLSIQTIHIIRSSYQNQESRLFLSQNEHPVYSEAINAAIKLYEMTGERSYFEKGFEFSERSRSSDFQTMLRELQAKEFGGIPDSLLQKEADLKGEKAAYENFIFLEKTQPSTDESKINRWKAKIFSIDQTYQQLINQIEKHYPRYYQYKYADPFVSAMKVQKALDRKEAFIEYFINEETSSDDKELFAFVITDHEYQIIRRKLTPEFDQTLDNFLHFIKSGLVYNTRKKDFQEYSKNALQLYKLLLEPFSTTLTDHRLVIVPDDKLSYLPFDAFIVSPGDTTKMDFRKLDYLVYHNAVSYTYSATLLYHYFQNKSKYSSNLGAFAPEYPQRFSKISSTKAPAEEQFYPLPGALKEVNRVTNIMSGELFLKEKATKTNFFKYAERYDILHLAMHTVLNDTLPLYSKFIFSQDSLSLNNRFLNTYEIYNLKLKSQMVVLSGCNTGTGKLQKGEGVMSLARAFLYAGCPSIIMTLWNVEDETSSLIMEQFYKNLKNGFSKDEALRRAKITHIQNADPLKAHPYYWLGYVSIGKQTPLFKTKIGYFVGLIIFVFLAIVLEKWYFRRKKRIN